MNAARKKEAKGIEVRFIGGPCEGRSRWAPELDLCYWLDMGRALYTRTGITEYTYRGDSRDRL